MNRRRLLVLGAVAGLLAISAGPLVGGGSSQADNPLPIVTIDRHTDLIDGQVLTINVKATSPGLVAVVAQAQLCRPGVTYQDGTDVTPPPDVVSNGPNCPQSPISTSGDGVIVDQGLPNASTPDGESFLYRIGSGVVDWTLRGTEDQHPPVSESLTCDESHPCSLVVEVRFSPGVDSSGNHEPPVWHPFVFPMAYASSNPLAACGAPLADPVASGGADFVQEPWIAWSLGACRRPGSKGALTRASFLGDGTAVTQYANGALDLAYTGGGFDNDMASGSQPNSGLVSPNLARRPSVAVPVALDAAVLGVAGGETVSSHKVPYKEIDMTAAEAAKMIGQGGLTGDDLKTFTGRSAPGNQQLGQTGLFDLSQSLTVAAYADAESFTWDATRYFKTRAPDAWVIPNDPRFGPFAGRQRGIDAALAQADPPFGISLETGRPALIKGLQALSSTSSGGVWILSDLQTANALRLVPVSLPDSAGTFVAPTAASLAAAVPSMKPDDQGILVPDPSKTPTGAYPLTFVEYALVPTQPLLNDDCTARSDAQNELADWLTYVTSPTGQQELPDGMAPLTDALKAQAADAIKRVGASPVTGKCANATQPPAIAPPAAPAAQAPDASVGAPASGLPSSTDIGTPAGVADVSQPPTLASEPVADAAAGSAGAGDTAASHLTAIPAFAGRSGAGWSPPVLALLGIITLTTLALAATAKTKKPT